MKRILLFVICIAAAAAAFGQQDTNYDEFYRNQYARMYKAYTQSPQSVAAMLDLATFYQAENNPMRDLSLAMKYVCMAEKRYVEMVEDKASYKEVSKLIKKQITVSSVRQKKQKIVEAARRYVATSHSISLSEIDNLEEAFPDDANMQRNLNLRRLEQQFAQAKTQGTLSAYYAFAQKYPGTAEADTANMEISRMAASLFEHAKNDKEVDSIAEPYADNPTVARMANKKKSSLAFYKTKQRNTQEGYRQFLQQYPQSDEYVEALEALDVLLASEYARLSTPRQLADFAKSNSDSQLGEKALEKLRDHIVKTHDVAAMKLYLKEFPLDEKYNDLFRMFYQWHAAEGNGDPIRNFTAEYPDYPYPIAVASDQERANRVDNIDLNVAYQEIYFGDFDLYVKKLMGRNIAFVALQRIMQQQIAARDWKNALARMDSYSICFENYSVDEYAELHELLSAPGDRRKNLEVEVLPTYEFRNPVVADGGRSMYFTKVENGVSTICKASTAAGKNYRWLNNGPVVFDNAQNKDLRIFSLYDNGSKMLLGSGGDIWMAEKQSNDHWRVTEIPPYPVNTDYLETDAYMSPDGTGLLLASDRPNGMNFQTSGAYFHGDTAKATDIYFIPRTENGWGEPINLGLDINTHCAEGSPVLSKDLRTLYYVTDGRGGLGYGDIYCATRNNVTSWTEWTNRHNFGKETNSGFAETDLSLSEDESRLYFVSRRNGGRFGCYSVGTGSEGINSSRKVQIDISRIALGPDPVTLIMADVESQSVVNTLEIQPQEGAANLTLYADKHYVAFAQAVGCFVPGTAFSPATQTKVDLRGYTLRDLQEMATPLPLTAVAFESETDKITAISEVEIRNLAIFLKTHPSTAVELIVNVDGREDIVCYNLSRERGLAVKKLLTQNEIDPSRITISNYGNVNFKNNRHTCEFMVLFHAR